MFPGQSLNTEHICCCLPSESLNEISPITKVKNYDTIKDEALSESEMLTYFYEDIYNIQQELITLLNLIER